MSNELCLETGTVKHVDKITREAKQSGMRNDQMLLIDMSYEKR